RPSRGGRFSLLRGNKERLSPDPGLRKCQHGRGNVVARSFARYRSARQLAAVYGHGSITASDEQARHVMLARGRLVRRKREAEWFAKAAPGELHIKIAGFNSLAVGTGWIAGDLYAVEGAVNQVLDAGESPVSPEMRGEVSYQIAREHFIVVEA